MKIQERLKRFIWHPNLNDDVTGASGNKTVWQLIWQGSQPGKKSILNPHHPHNAARKNLARTGEIINITIVSNLSEGAQVKAAAQTIIPNP